MDKNELLIKVKQNLLITGNYHDDLLANYIAEVKAFLIDSGVKETIVNSKKSIGIISRGVVDLWNYGNGQTTFSNYFMQRAIQLVLKGGDNNA